MAGFLIAHPLMVPIPPHTKAFAGKHLQPVQQGLQQCGRPKLYGQQVDVLKLLPDILSLMKQV